MKGVATTASRNEQWRSGGRNGCDKKNSILVDKYVGQVLDTS